jgi:hypothetical protein
MDDQVLAVPGQQLEREPDELLPDQPCAGRYSACGHTCWLEDGSWTFETTIPVGGIDSDVQAYCRCEHHDGADGSAAGLMEVVRERLDLARRPAG